MKSVPTLITTLTLSLILTVSMSVVAQQATTSAPSSVSAGYKLTVVVSDVNTRSGKLYVGLANNDETFRGESLKQLSADVTPSGEISVTFEGVAPGRYAVRVYQDLNNNQKIDFAGQMPTEPFGFSNVTQLMGPPSFEQSAFDLKADQTIRITLIQM